MEHLQACPLCGCSQFAHYLTTTDYFLSRETFTVVKCKECSLLFTNPRPENPDRYYESQQYLSHTGHQPGLLPMAYRIIRKYNLKRKYRLLEKYRKPARLLDIGCGTGEFLAMGRSRGWTVSGVEPNAAARNYATSVNSLDVRDLTALDSFQPASFHVITLWHVLEHMPQPNQSMELISKLLAPGGLLVIAVPNAGSYDAQHYGASWAAWDLPRHLLHFTPVTLRTLLEKSGFTIVATSQLIPDAYYISLLSSSYQTGKKKFLSAAWHGYKSNHLAAKQNQNYSSIIFLGER